MSDCSFLPDPLGWRCPQCNYFYPRKTERPPRRNCPRAPSAAERLTRDIAAAIANQQSYVTAVEIERRLALCREEECREKFLGAGCRNCTCKNGNGAWFAGLIFAADAEKRWVCERWAANRG